MIYAGFHVYWNTIFEAVQNKNPWKMLCSHSACSAIMIWERTSSEQVVLSIHFLIKFLQSVPQCGCYGCSRDAPLACFCPSFLSSTFAGWGCLGLPPQPLGSCADSVAAPGSALYLGPASQLPWKLRAFEVSSLHLAAYVGTGGRWRLLKRLPCEIASERFTSQLMVSVRPSTFWVSQILTQDTIMTPCAAL